MLRFRSLVPVVAALLLGALAVAGLRPALAQEATPAAGDFGLPGVTFDPLGFGTAAELPAAPADLFLTRILLEPGAVLPANAGDPTVTLAYVEEGAVTVNVDAPVRVLRGATLARFATPGAVAEGEVPVPEEAAAGAEFTLAAGDSGLFPGFVTGEVRNDGTERAVLLLANVSPAMGAAGTPVAGG